ncbi:MAG: class I SAM-dependent methyltransferase, partial [Sinomicrobium sp.]|nr:class I SAM-dependent methyltransferase [Sinomicrobium sp.]
RMPSLESVTHVMKVAGFRSITTENYSVRPSLKDLFLYSGKQRPEIYLRPGVRNGISSFSDLANADEVRKGLEKLNADSSSRKIDTIIKRYENNVGDYIFIIGKK